jgi:hypothetical protein
MKLGAGPFVGLVTAAAVILPRDLQILSLNQFFIHFFMFENTNKG